MARLEVIQDFGQMKRWRKVSPDRAVNMNQDQRKYDRSQKLKMFIFQNREFSVLSLNNSVVRLYHLRLGGGGA